MKKHIIKSVSSLLCLLLLAACSGSGNKADSDAYLNVIPNDAMVVSKVDFNNLLVKSDILNNTFVKVEFEKAVTELPDKQNDLLKKIFANPSASGIDVDAPVYIAVQSVKPGKMIATARMSDISNFEDFISTFVGDDFKTTQKDGMTYLALDEVYLSLGDVALALAYDKDKIMLVVDEYYPDLSSYTRLSMDKRAVNDEVYAPLFKGDEDVACAVNYEPIVQYIIAEKLIDRELVPIVATMKENVYFTSLDFEDGYVEVKSTSDISYESREMIEGLLKKSTHRHYDYIPGNSFAVMSYNLNLIQLYSILETSGALKELAGYGVNNEVAKDLLVALSGDYTAAAWVDGDDFEDLNYMAAVDCSDRSLFDMLAAYMIMSLDATMVEEDVYELYDGYYIMYKDNAIMLMPESIFRKINSRSGIRPLRRNINSKELFNSSYDIVVDLRLVGNIISKCMRDISGVLSSEQMVALDMLNTVDNLTVETGVGNSYLRVNTTNPKINSLRYILDKYISSAVRNSRGRY